MFKPIQLVLFTSLCLFFYTAPLSAQSSITLENEAVTIDFPDVITFEANAEAASSSTTIEKATLIYGTNGRSCQTSGSKQTIDFDPSSSVELSWEWELKRSGSIPPGAEIWWQWEIEDAEGNVLTTERQTQQVADGRYDWRTLEDDGVQVNWIQGDNAFGQSIMDITNDSLALIASDMGVERPDDIYIWVYPTSDEMRDSLVFSSEWAGGVAFDDYGITLVGIAPSQDRWKKQVVPHELVHLVIGELIFNCYGTDLPLWLNEGLARYAEPRNLEADVGSLQIALEAGELPPLKTLERSFSAYGGDAGLSYTQSFIVVKYLIDQYGPTQMRNLLNTIKEGNKIDDALEIVYGVDTIGLDVEWRQSVGFSPTPTLASDALAANATPTVIATLALANPLASPPTMTPTPAPATAVPATAIPATQPTEAPTSEPTAASAVADAAAANTTEDVLENVLESEDAPAEIPAETEEISPNTPESEANSTILLVIGALVIGLIIGSLALFMGKRRSS